MSLQDNEYPVEFLDRLEIVWGRGYLSPGGAEEVKRIVEGLTLAGRSVLDIGCGTCGPAIALAGVLEAAKVIGIDVEKAILTRAEQNIDAAGLARKIDVRLVEPGPIPLPDGSVDIIFSKDAMLHIPDKLALFHEVLRVLRPGGVFAASDWLAGANAAASPEWVRYCELGHLTFTMATVAESTANMDAAGFERVSSEDRNAWYAELCSAEVERIAGPLRKTLIGVSNEAIYTNWLNARRALASAVAAGAMRPTHLRGFKPTVI